MKHITRCVDVILHLLVIGSHLLKRTVCLVIKFILYILRILILRYNLGKAKGMVGIHVQKGMIVCVASYS